MTNYQYWTTIITAVISSDCTNKKDNILLIFTRLVLPSSTSNFQRVQGTEPQTNTEILWAINYVFGTNSNRLIFFFLHYATHELTFICPCGQLTVTHYVKVISNVSNNNTYITYNTLQTIKNYTLSVNLSDFLGLFKKICIKYWKTISLNIIYSQSVASPVCCGVIRTQWYPGLLLFISNHILYTKLLPRFIYTKCL